MKALPFSILLLLASFALPLFAQETFTPYVAKVSGESVRLRSGASLAHPPVFVMKKGGELTVVGQKEDWATVQLPAGAPNHSTRSMVLYEASTTGCDYLNGYAMLPANIDGSVVTTPSAVDRGTSVYDMRANPYYLDGHEVRGGFTSVGTKRIEWTITADDSGVTITIDGVASFHAAP